MAVCRGWQEIIIKNPLCWTHVEIGSNLHPVASPFLRSGSTQLVSTTMDFRTLAANNISVEDACALTMKHHTQLRGLDVIVTHWAQISYFLEIWKRNQIATPHLKSISVTGIDPDFQPRSFTPTAAWPKYDNDWPGAARVESLTLFSFNLFALPAFKNLRFLEISITGVPTDILQHIFEASPLIETLIVRQYYILSNQDSSTQTEIRAPALRFLGIGLSEKLLWAAEFDDFFDMIAPNLEGLDVQLCQWCNTGVNSRLTNSPKFRRLRVREELKHRNLEFLKTLPSTLSLEIVRMPTSPATIEGIFRLSNLEQIIWSLAEGIYEDEVEQWKNFWQIVRMRKLSARSPMIIDVPVGANPPVDVFHMLGSTVTLRLKAKKWDTWLLGHEGIEYDFRYLDGGRLLI